MPTVQDYILRFGTPGVFVRLVNNVTATAYVSTAATDANGLFTITGVPVGLYTVFTGPSATGPWAASGDSNYVVGGGGGAASTADHIMYVSKQGNDANDGLSWATAKLTIGAAITANGQGEIRVGIGTFVETVTIGVNNGQLRLIGAGQGVGSANATIIQAPANNADCIFINGTSQVHIEAIGTTGNGLNWTGIGLHVSGSPQTHVVDWLHRNGDNTATATMGGTGIQIDNSEGCLFERCTISETNLAVRLMVMADENMFIDLRGSRNWQDLVEDVNTGGTMFVHAKMTATRGPASVVLNGDGLIFLQADFDESSTSNTWTINGNHHQLTSCSVAPQTTFVLNGSACRLESLVVPGFATIAGSDNIIIGMSIRGGTVSVTGQRNVWMKPEILANSTVTLDPSTVQLPGTVPNNRGAFSGLVAYNPGDVVQVGSIAYITPSTTVAGTVPPAAPWVLFAGSAGGASTGGFGIQRADLPAGSTYAAGLLLPEKQWFQSDLSAPTTPEFDTTFISGESPTELRMLYDEGSWLGYNGGYDQNTGAGGPSVKMPYVTGPLKRMAFGNPTLAGSIAEYPVDGLLGIDQFQIEFLLISNGFDYTLQPTQTDNTYLIVSDNNSPYSIINVFRPPNAGGAAQIQADLIGTSFTLSAVLTLVAGDIPSNTWKRLSVTWDGTKVTLRLGQDVKVANSGNLPANTNLTTKLQGFAGTLDILGKPSWAGNPAAFAYPFGMADVHVRRWPRVSGNFTTYNAAAQKPKITINPTLNNAGISPTSTADSSANTRTATGSGTVVATPWTGGSYAGFSNALLFDGGLNGATSQGFITAPVATTAAFCVEGKVRRDRQGFTEVCLGWMDLTTTTKYVMWLGFVSTDNKLHGRVFDHTGAASLVDLTSTAIVPNGIHDVALDWDGTNVRLFLDGTLQATGALASIGNARSAPFSLGRFAGYTPTDPASPYPFQGVVEEARFSSVSRRTANYTPAVAPFASDASTMALYHLDSTTSTPTVFPQAITGVVQQNGLTGADLSRLQIQATSAGMSTIRANWQSTGTGANDLIDVVNNAGTLTYDYTKWDAMHDPWRVAGANKIHLWFGYTPAFLQPGAGQYNQPPTNNTLYAQYCSDLLAHMVTKGWNIVALSFWNEPISSGFWQGTQAQLVACWLAVAQKIAASNPGYNLGGLEDVWTNDNIQQKAVIDQANTSALPLPALHLHNYADQVTVLREINEMQAYAATKGFNNIPVRLTEWGYNNNVTSGGQGRFSGWGGAYEDVAGPHKGTRQAHYVLPLLSNILKTGSDVAAFFQFATAPSYNPDYGLLDASVSPPHFLPTYATFAMLWKLKGNWIYTNPNFPHLYALGTYDPVGLRTTVVYGSYRPWRKKDKLSFNLEFVTGSLPVAFTWKQWQNDLETNPDDGRLMLVGSGDQTNLPAAVRMTAMGVGCIQIQG